MTANSAENPNLYENGRACVRSLYQDGKPRYYVLFSEDGNLKKEYSEMKREFDFSTTKNDRSEEENLEIAKLICDCCNSPQIDEYKEGEIKGCPIIYSKGSVCVTYVYEGCYRLHIRSFSGGYKHYFGRKLYELSKYFPNFSIAKVRCDRLASRESRRSISACDTYDKDNFENLGQGLGTLVFMLLLVGFISKPNLFGIEVSANPFTSEGLSLLLLDWWQILLCFLLAECFAAFFLGLSYVRRFSFSYRVFVKHFGIIQGFLHATLAAIITLYWTLYGIWRVLLYGWKSIFPPPEEIGYPHFGVMLIYIAVITWGVVSFMRYKKRKAFQGV